MTETGPGAFPGPSFLTEEENMTDIKIGGRTIPLYLSTWEMIEIQKQIGCTAAQLRDEVFGLHLADENDPESWRFEVGTDPERMEKLGKLIAILGNAGLEEEGGEPDLTAKWVLRHMSPRDVLPYSITVMVEINAGLIGETAQKAEAEQGPVDVMVEEETAKKTQRK